MVAEGLIVSALVVLTPTEQEKLECKDLEKAINNIADDLHVKWAVEINGNVATATISKQFGPVVGESQAHEVEIAATNFMRGIEHLVVPCATKDIIKDVDDDEDEVVVVFIVGENAARVIKSIRECTNATLAIAKQYAENGRIVCAKDEAQSIIDNLEVAGAKHVHIDEKLTSHLTFCKDVIDNWEDEDVQGYVCGAQIMAKFKDLPDLTVEMGRISGDLLKDMFVTYIQNM
jgi:ribosomal protein L7/L12